MRTPRRAVLLGRSPQTTAVAVGSGVVVGTVTVALGAVGATDSLPELRLVSLLGVALLAGLAAAGATATARGAGVAGPLALGLGPLFGLALVGRHYLSGGHSAFGHDPVTAVLLEAVSHALPFGLVVGALGYAAGVAWHRRDEADLATVGLLGRDERTSVRLLAVGTAASLGLFAVELLATHVGPAVPVSVGAAVLLAAGAVHQREAPARAGSTALLATVPLAALAERGAATFLLDATVFAVVVLLVALVAARNDGLAVCVVLGMVPLFLLGVRGALAPNWFDGPPPVLVVVLTGGLLGAVGGAPAGLAGYALGRAAATDAATTGRADGDDRAPPASDGVVRIDSYN